jgi:methionine-rich copper-binding protein CopC
LVDMGAGNTNWLVQKGILLLPVLVLAGCTAGNGEGLDQNGGLIPITPPVDSDFQQIQDTIFTPICTACHVGANAPQGLRLDAANSFALLVNVSSNEVPGTLRVNPGNPNASYIVQKLQGTNAVGARMPFGGPYLSQPQIDLVRSWIAAGALPPPAAASNKLTVASTIPARAEFAAGAIDRLTVIFSTRLDTSRVGATTFELRDGLDAPVALAQVRVPDGRPNVVELELARPLPAGSYQLEVRGAGPAALADDAGHVLDGDADGVAGGDYFMSFDVPSGAH